MTAAGRYRGPGTALAAERARQARMMTVGPVTERWAPEQAGPVYEHWRLAPPVGPAADFWALGALLFRAVQGYPPYPEEGAAALSQAVCAEQPAFAEDCGALRPIVESLLRQDPTERPSAEELRGWLRSLLRSAPEPEVGRRTVTAPPAALEPGRPADPRRLPIVRRRGPLVGPLRRRARAHRTPPRPFRLGSLLLGLVTLGMAGAIVFALLVMSDGGSAGRGSGSQDPGTTQAADGTAPEDTGGSQAGGQGQSGGSDDTATGDTQPTEDSQGTGEDTGADSGADTGEDAAVPDGYESRQDPAGFALTVPEGWERREAEEGRVIYTDGTVEIVVVSGRDTASRYGDDPMHYQLQDQSELDAFRDDQYATSSDLYETKVGDSVAAEGVFGWQEDGAQRVAHNMAVLIDDRYHVVMVRGPESESDEMSDIYDVVAQSYEITG